MQEWEKQLEDLVSSGLVDFDGQTYTLTPLCYEIRRKYLANIPLDQNERDHILLTGSTIKEICEALG